MLGFKALIKLRKYKKYIKKSGLFDVKYYLKSNRDVRLSNETPFNHFCKIGLKEKRKPNINFDPIWYESYYEDIKKSNFNPLIHFIQYGLYENRFMNEKEANEYHVIKNSKLFNEQYYINSYVDLQDQEEDFDFLLHYIRYGEKEGRKPNKSFNPHWYRGFYPDLKISNMNILFHFVMYGKSENRFMNKEEFAEYELIKLSNLFDTTFYRTQHKDLLKVKKSFNLLLHYIRYGENEGRQPNIIFNPKWYLNNNLDLKFNNTKPLLHYIRYGEKNGKNPSPLFDIDWYLKTYNISDYKPLAHFLTKGLIEGALPYKEFQKDLIESQMDAYHFLVKYSNRNILKPKKINDKNFSKVYNEDLPENIVTSLKVAVVVSISSMDKLENIISKVLLLPYESMVYFVLDPIQKESLDKALKKSNITNFKIVNKASSDNFLDSFLSILLSLKELKYDIICNIQDIDFLMNPKDNELLFDILLKSALGSSTSIYNVIRAFEDDKNLGIIGSADCYKSSQKTTLSTTDKKTIAKLLETVDSNYDFAQNWGYFVGNIFWARVSLFEPLFNNKSFLRVIKEDNISLDSFLLDKVFGTLPNIQRMSSALIYGIDIERNRHVIEIASKDSFTPSPLTIDTTLENEKSIKEDYAFLKENKSFDSLFYLKQRPIIEELTINPVLDFLRYGLYQNISPNKDFSPFAYWSSSNIETIFKKNPFVHFLTTKNSDIVMPSEENYHFAKEKIKKSELFDSSAYHDLNSDVKNAGFDPLTHYCKYGWKEDREVKSEIDVLWYKQEYLAHYLSPVNPLLHYILIGKKRGYLKKPILSQPLTIKSKPLTKTSKRISLFAGYDVDGLIDESVVLFVKELSRHSDVYFLSDSQLENGELDKLKGFVKGAWGIRHGEYDFGSYKRLACYLVGWDKIKEYDELILVNDSSYLLKPLDEMFEKMNGKDCSWWGAQATKGISATKDKKSNKFTQKIAIKKVKKEYLNNYMMEDEYDFLMGSYFLAFRKEVLLQNELKDLLSNVKKERNKKNIILKYEIGLTKNLILKGYDFDTVVDHLYPFHPIYTNQIFELIKEGYPFFKRFFLTENHYYVPELWQWKEKLVELVPSLDLKPIESNLYRIADAGKLQTNLHIKADGSNLLLTDEEFIERDKTSIVENNYWVFPVCAFDHTFSGNERAVFEEVKDNPNIKKIILFRSKKIELDGVNTEFVPLLSREGQEVLLNSNVIFIKHTAYRNAVYPLNPKKHKFINLWHGIPLKRIGATSLDLQSNMKALVEEHKKLYSVIASSSIDRMAMATAFYPLTYNDVWVTGLPRNDFILKEESILPVDFKNDLKRLEKLIDGKRFILYAPTFRNAQSDGYYHFSSEEKTLLHSYLKKNNIILGIREHMADKAHSYSQELKGEYVINVGGNNFSNIEILYRKADLLITDYSSCFIDFMLTGKPMISFAFDYENYTKEERGLFYSLEFAFAGKICEDFDTLFTQIQKIMSEENHTLSEAYKYKQKVFFDYLDAKNSQRLVDKVINIIN